MRTIVLITMLIHCESIVLFYKTIWECQVKNKWYDNYCGYGLYLFPSLIFYNYCCALLLKKQLLLFFLSYLLELVFYISEKTKCRNTLSTIYSHSIFFIVLNILLYRLTPVASNIYSTMTFVLSPYLNFLWGLWDSVAISLYIDQFPLMDNNFIFLF